MPRARRVAAAAAVVVLCATMAACTLDPTAGVSQTPGSGDSSGTTSGATTDPAVTTPAATDPATDPASSPTTGQTTSPTTTSPSTPPTHDDAGDAPEFRPAGLSDRGEGTGSDVGSLVDVRVGAQDGFDRVVVELDGPDIPAWDVGYVDQALGDPSGIVVDVAGDSVIQVLLHPVAYPEAGADPYDGPQKVASAGTTSVTEAVLSSIFEGELQLFVGVQGGSQPYRVYGMSDPARIVVEVYAPLGS